MRINIRTFFNFLGSAVPVIAITLTATFSQPQVPHHTSPNPPWLQGILSVTLTSPWSVYEAGNTPHDPHRDRKRCVVRWRNLGESCNFFPISYKEPGRLRLRIVVAINLRTSSKKSASFAAAEPLSSLRTWRSSSSRNRCNAGRKDSELTSVRFRMTKLWGRITGKLVDSSSGWNMEILVMAGMYLAGNGEKDQV